MCSGGRRPETVDEISSLLHLALHPSRFIEDFSGIAVIQVTPGIQTTSSSLKRFLISSSAIQLARRATGFPGPLHGLPPQLHNCGLGARGRGGWVKR